MKTIFDVRRIDHVVLRVRDLERSVRFYGDVLGERVFKPAKMTTARIISEADIIPNRAAGYRLVKGELKNQEWVAPSLNTTGDGSLYVSVKDMLAWDAAVTLTASYEKVFSANPKLGFFAQRDKFNDAIAQGTVLPPAKSMDDMHAVVTNSTVDGVLSAFFAILIIVVIADATRIAVKAIRAGGLPTTEVPASESHLRAPSGLFTRREEYERVGT